MRAAHLTMALFLLAGCGSSDDDAGPGAVTVTPALLDFGVVALDESATLTFTLENTGGTPVDVLSVSLVEGDTALWRVDKAGLATLEGGASAAVSVAFTPRETGGYAGEIQVRTSSESTASLFVALVASGAESTADDDGDGFSPADGDCDDDDASAYPGAPELCNGRDDDCDDSVPADEADDDYDGVHLCAGDCDDADPAVYPGAPEICDGKDSDCEGGANDDADVDGDGYSVCDDDCDDTSDDVHPEAVEVCDGVDNDCNGGADDLDADNDGHSLCSAAGDCDDNDPDAFPVVVSNSGSSSGAGTDLDPYDTLATAASNLDAVCRTIRLEPGSYELEGAWSDGVLSVVGTGSDPADTEIVALPDQRVLTVLAGGALTFENLTLTGGDAPGDGGAINVANGGSLTLRDVVARGNTSSTDGGAVAVASGTLVLEGACVFEDNTAIDDGGAIAVSSSVFLDTEGTLYQRNTGSQGGALYVSSGISEIVGAELRSNSAAEEGGAVAITGSGSYLVQGNRIVLNDAATGGGLALRDVLDLAGYIRNNEIQDNAAGVVGGGIAVTGTSGAIIIINNTLVANSAPGEGGGLHVAPVVADLLAVWGNIIGWSDGLSGTWVAVGSTAWLESNTGFLTSSGVEFAGAVAVDVDENVVRDPMLITVSPSDGNPDNDDLGLRVGSPEIDSGPSHASLNDTDGTRNDRGATGGPGASP